MGRDCPFTELSITNWTLLFIRSELAGVTGTAPTGYPGETASHFSGLHRWAHRWGADELTGETIAHWWAHMWSYSFYWWAHLWGCSIYTGHLLCGATLSTGAACEAILAIGELRGQSSVNWWDNHDTVRQIPNSESLVFCYQLLSMCGATLTDHRCVNRLWANLQIKPECLV